MLGGIFSGVSQLLSRLTGTRAGYLDKLNITGSKVADGADYTAARAAKLDYLDASVAARPTNPLLTTDSRLNYLDASVAARPTSMIKSVQRGSVTFNSGEGTKTPTITSVNTSKSLLTFSFSTDNALVNNVMVRGLIASSTSLQFLRSGTSGGVVVEWQVTEFN